MGKKTTKAKGEELERKVRLLENVLENTATIAVAYAPSGAVLSASFSAPPTRTNLLAAKTALQMLLRNVDNALLAVVEKEAAQTAKKEQSGPEPTPSS